MIPSMLLVTGQQVSSLSALINNRRNKQDAFSNILGKTSIPHDTEDPTEVKNCADAGCYTRPIQYEASMRQMNALADLSSECHQSIRVSSSIAVKFQRHFSII